METYKNYQPITITKIDDVGDTELDIRITNSKGSAWRLSSNDIALAELTLTQPAPNGYMVFVQNQSRPKYIHPTYEEAVTEAHRLAKQSQNINCKVYILAVLRSVIGTVSVNEVDL